MKKIIQLSNHEAEVIDFASWGSGAPATEKKDEPKKAAAPKKEEVK